MTTTTRPHVVVAVVMRRERIQGPMSRWQTWRWVLDDVVMNEAGFGEPPRLLYSGEDEEKWLYPAMPVELFVDDAEGYHLNVSTEAPAWFVLWRLHESAVEGEEPVAKPEMVSLSYYDAGRWLDAQETVEQVRAPAEVVEWLKAFVAEHLVQEPKRRRRPESFRSLTDRFGNPVSITTEKKGGSGHG